MAHGVLAAAMQCMRTWCPCDGRSRAAGRQLQHQHDCALAGVVGAVEAVDQLGHALWPAGLALHLSKQLLLLAWWHDRFDEHWGGGVVVRSITGRGQLLCGVRATPRVKAGPPTALTSLQLHM